jgi:hypothetical protein
MRGAWRKAVRGQDATPSRNWRQRLNFQAAILPVASVAGNIFFY